MEIAATSDPPTDFICRVSPEMVMLEVSPSVFAVLGWMPDELVGTLPPALILAEDLPIFAAAHAYNLIPDMESRPVVVRELKKDGSTAWMEITSRIVRDPGTGEHRETINVMRDVTASKILEDERHALALTDELTGLANLRAFDEHLLREWSRTQLEDAEMSLVLIAFDGFREDDESHGHVIGDELFRAAAALVRSAVDETGFACRYHGEGIAIILPAAGAVGAMQAAEEFLLAVERLELTHDATALGIQRVNASIGLATAFARHGGTMPMPASLVLAADTALVEARQIAGNRIATAPLVAKS